MIIHKEKKVVKNKKGIMKERKILVALTRNLRKHFADL